MKTFIVLIHNDDDVAVVRERLTQLGSCFVFYDKEFLVETTLNTAREVYNQIENTDQFEIVVFEINILEIDSYWGFANIELWNWLKDRQLKDNKPST